MHSNTAAHAQHTWCISVRHRRCCQVTAARRSTGVATSDPHAETLENFEHPGGKHQYHVHSSEVVGSLQLSGGSNGDSTAGSATTATLDKQPLSKVPAVADTSGQLLQLPQWLRSRVSYDRLTQLLVAASVMPAIALALQPVVAWLLTSDAAAAAAAATAPSFDWQGALRDMFSFTVLLSVFINCEPMAAVAAAVSAAGGAAVLLLAPYWRLPIQANCIATFLVMCAVLIVLTAAGIKREQQQAGRGNKHKDDARNQGDKQACLQHSIAAVRDKPQQHQPWQQAMAIRLTHHQALQTIQQAGLVAHSSSEQGQAQQQRQWHQQWQPQTWIQQPWQLDTVMRKVQRVLGILGGGLLAQFLSTLLPGTPAGILLATPVAAHNVTAILEWLVPLASGTAAVTWAGIAMTCSNNKYWLALWDDWPAWSATLLLIFQPLLQLVQTACDPRQLLPAVPTAQQLLLLFANGLMVPRAFLLGELMWFTGTCSAAALAAGQLWVLAIYHLMQLTLGWLPDRVAVATTIAAMGGALLMSFWVLQTGWRDMARRKQQAAAPSKPMIIAPK